MNERTGIMNGKWTIAQIKAIRGQDNERSGQ